MNTQKSERECGERRPKWCKINLWHVMLVLKLMCLCVLEWLRSVPSQGFGSSGNGRPTDCEGLFELTRRNPNTPLGYLYARFLSSKFLFSGGWKSRAYTTLSITMWYSHFHYMHFTATVKEFNLIIHLKSSSFFLHQGVCTSIRVLAPLSLAVCLLQQFHVKYMHIAKVSLVGTLRNIIHTN